MKIAEAISIAHAQRDALDRKARSVLEPFEQTGDVGALRGVPTEDVRELAELALSAAHHWKLESSRSRSAGDLVGATIGYALLAVVLLIAGAGAVWLVRSAWGWAL